MSYLINFSYICANGSSSIMTCHSRLPLLYRTCSAPGPIDGWLFGLQLPLESQNALESRTATLVWYELLKIRFGPETAARAKSKRSPQLAMSVSLILLSLS